MKKTQWAIGLATALLAALLEGSSGLPDRVIGSTAVQIPPLFHDAVRAAQARGDESIEMELSVQSRAGLKRLKESIAKAGGEVVAEEELTVRAKLPPAAAQSVPDTVPLTSVSLNQNLTLDGSRVATKDQAITALDAIGMAALNIEAIGMEAFRQNLGVTGSGLTVAVIDTGIDALHPDLRQTSSGQPKVTDWKDFTGEGGVVTSSTLPWSEYYQASDGRRYRLPLRPEASSSARFGFWEEFTISGPYINRDLDQNGIQTDRFGVLLVDALQSGRFDTVYVDTNNDSDFTDEEPLGIYSQSQTVGQMGRFRSERLAASRLSFVVADLDPAGKWVSLGFDGLGHGTQVAGVLGAYSSQGFLGIAPGVQLMALKAVGSSGSGDWFAIKQAITYAAENGAQIINISVGGLAASAARFDSTASEWLNQIARTYGVLIVMAADNSGPGLSSGATLGNPAEVMAVGAYFSPEMWKRDLGYVVPNESIWSLSGMGPRSDGSYVPSVVAPGGSPTTSPLWRHSTGYTTAVGTSIATPHVSGAAALLMDAGRRQGIQYDRISVKQALELGARVIAGFGIFEQGHGLLSLQAAFAHLQQIKTAPALMTGSREGDGGLLARSFTPGSTSIWVTNLGPVMSRANVFGTENWVKTTFNSLTLPVGVPRQIPVQINPPQEPGIHSAFLMVRDQGHSRSLLTVPVTYVRPLELNPENQFKQAASGRLEVARFQRYFFRVEPGAARFNVTTRSQMEPLGPNGTVQLHVFRPDGQAVHVAEIGANGAGLSSLFTTENPVGGVWEVVVTALPDTEGLYLEAGYALEAEVQPAPIPAAALKLNIAPGSITTHTVPFINTFGPFTGKLEAVGLTLLDSAGLWSQGVPWRVERKLQNLVEDFVLSQPAASMRIEISNPVPAGVDLDLYLYYLDSAADWILHGEAVAPGSSREVIELTNLKAGRYQSLAVARGASPPQFQYQYRRLVGVNKGNLSMAAELRHYPANEISDNALTIFAPTLPGRYSGQILVRDTERNRTLAWIPVELSVGQPALSVEPLVSQLARGESGSVMLELRSTATGRLTDAQITINGQRFASRNGLVTLPVRPQGDRLFLDVLADAPGYQYLNRQITLPVKDNWGFHPFGIDPSEEFSVWRRKLTTLTTQLRN